MTHDQSLKLIQAYQFLLAKIQDELTPACNHLISSKIADSSFLRSKIYKMDDLIKDFQKQLRSHTEKGE